MKRLIFIAILIMGLSATWAKKPAKVIYFPSDTMTVLGSVFMKAGIGTKQEMKDQTYKTYYISMLPIRVTQFVDFINAIKTIRGFGSSVSDDKGNFLCRIFDTYFNCVKEIDYDYVSEKYSFNGQQDLFMYDVTCYGADGFCKYVQETTGKNVRLPRPEELYPTFEKNILKYLKENENILSKEEEQNMRMLCKNSSKIMDEWAKGEDGDFYIMDYDEKYAPVLNALLAPALITLVGVVPWAIANLATPARCGMNKKRPQGGYNNPDSPYYEWNLGFRLVVPAQ